MYPRKIRKLLETELYNRNFIKGINAWVVSLCKIFWNILKMGKRGTKTNGLEDKKVDDYAPRDDIDYM